MEGKRLRIPADSSMPVRAMICAAVMFLMRCVHLTLYQWEPLFQITPPVTFINMNAFIISLYDTSICVALFLLAMKYAKIDLELVGLPLFFQMLWDIYLVFFSLIQSYHWMRDASWLMWRFLLVFMYVALFLVFSLTAFGTLKNRTPLMYLGFGCAGVLVLMTVVGIGPFTNHSYGVRGISQCISSAAIFLAYGFLGMGLDASETADYLRVGNIRYIDPEKMNGSRVPCELLQRKNIGICLLLNLFTISIYTYVWAYSIMKKIRLLSGKDTDCGGELLCFMFVPFYKFFWFYTRGGEISGQASYWGVELKRRQGCYLAISLLLNAPIALAVMQSELNGFAERMEEVIELERGYRA